ncbi:MAG: phage tail sheath family protein [bacterium]
MRDYKTPGVYVEEKSVLPGSVAGVSTAIPAFIGYTEKAGVNDELINKPTKIKTLKEYEELFGTAPNEEIEVEVTGQNITSITIPPLTKLMYYSMQMFFNNGGESCYIVSVSNDGNALDNFKDALDSLKLEDEPTLIVPVDGVTMNPDDAADYHSLCQQILLQCSQLKDRFAILDVIETNNGTEDDADSFRGGCGTENLKYGAAYYPYIQTVLNYQYSDDSVLVNIAASIDFEPAIELGDNSIKVDQTELYNKIKNEISKKRVILPPSSAVAGAYASVDRDRGVWKAPANVSLLSVIGPTKKLTESENDNLNVDPQSGKSINAIRTFTGKGTLIWGARTLAGNDNEWRYVPVRRLFNYIEESIQKATSFAVFEPNNAMTWLKLRSMVESFLDGLWRQGALAGGKAEDAYFVQVGLGTTMTSQDILEGRLIIKVGLAAVRPAEFIILEFTHKLQES